MPFCRNCGKQSESGALFCESCEAAANSAANNKSIDCELSFRGDSATLFKIWISNLLLTICTLGIYYPWGRANMKRYIYSSTYIGDYSFEFHGKGKQMFFGLLKFWGITFIFLVVWIAIIALLVPDIDWLIEVVAWVLIISYVPILGLFIHGARKFRLSRTSYRGIRFGYRGEKKPLILLMILAVIPFAYPYFINKFRKYVYGNTRFGNVEAQFTGDDNAYAKIYWHSVFLCIVTLGIYYPWYKMRLFNFFWENLSFKKDGTIIEVVPKSTAEGFFKLKAGNLLILIFTLGLGSPITKIRNMRFFADNLELYGNIDLDTVIQTEEQYLNALGDAATDMDDSADFFDMDIF